MNFTVNFFAKICYLFNLGPDSVHICFPPSFDGKEVPSSKHCGCTMVVLDSEPLPPDCPTDTARLLLLGQSNGREERQQW